MSTQRTIKVFIASPGDLAVERRAFKDVIDELNQGYGRGAHVTFEPLGWEDALSTVGRRSQSVINQDIDACDVLSWSCGGAGDRTCPTRGRTHHTPRKSSIALARFEKEGKPTIFVFFKNIDAGQMADPGSAIGKSSGFPQEA